MEDKGVLNIDNPIIIPTAKISDPSRMLPRSCRFLAWPIGSASVHQQAFQRRLPDAPSKASQEIPWLGTRNTGESSVVGVMRGKLVMTHSL